MADTPSARMQDSAGGARPANEASRPAGLSPEETEAANRALQHALATVPTGSGSPFARLKPMRGATVPPIAQQNPRYTWDRLRPQQILVGLIVLFGAVGAAAIGILLAANTDSAATTVATAIPTEPAANAPTSAPEGAAPGVAASPTSGAPSATTATSTTAAATSTVAPTSPPATATVAPSPTTIPAGMAPIERVTSSEPLVPAMPESPAGFHSAWLTAPGEDCSAVVGAYRPQELVENANPGLNTGARCSDLSPGTWLCRDAIDRGMTGSPPCLGAVRVPAGLVLVWGILGASESSPSAATVALGVPTDTGADVSPSLGRISLAAPHGACLFTFPPTVNGDVAVFEVEGVAAPLIFDILASAGDVDVSNLPACI